MMKSQVFKLCIREIKASFGRYMAIFAIIALGAGFFMGLRMSRPDFIETYDRYTQRFDFFNYRLVSTLGLTDDDLDLVRDMDFVTDAEGAKSADFMVRDGDDNLIIIAHSIPKRINKIDLIAGRMPEKPNECLADPEMYTEGDIGKTIKLSPDNGSATFDSFAYDSYTITGITESVSYINLERGSSTLGNGSVAGYIYIPEDGFALDCYTDIYLTLDISGYVYSDEYEENAEKYREPLESFMEERAKVRYDSIIDSATEALSEAREEYEKGLAQYEPSKAKYDAARSEFDEGKAAAMAELDKAEAELKQAEAIAGDKTAIQQKQDEIDKARAELDAGYIEYERGLNAYNLRYEAELRTVNAQVDYYSAKVAEKQQEIADAEAELSSLNAQLADASGPEAVRLRSEIRRTELRINTSTNELQIVQSRLDEHLSRKAEKEAELAPLKQQLDDAKAQLDAGYAQLNEAQAALDQVKNGSVADARAEFDRKKAEVLARFDGAEAELNAAKAQLDDAKAQLDDAKAQLDDAEKQIKNMNNADTYVLGRDTNIGYACFETDTRIVDSVANVFPLFFVLVAALVCLTTMTRMINDQRTQVGVLKALGYGPGAIMAKYLIYSGSATLFGCVFGIGIGVYVFPFIVWVGYGIIYNFSGLVFNVNWLLAAEITAANLAAMLLVTWLCCRSELKEVPAELIRPKAPEAGKRTLLERITFIWKRFSFMQKVSARNVLRYKKRIYMMLLGIGGCTALILTAFGLNDTVKSVVDQQYGKVSLYDYELSLAYDMTDDEQALILDAWGDDAEKALFLYRGSADVSANGIIKTVTLSAAQDGVDGFVDLHDGDEKIPYPGKNEAVINYNLARTMELEVGDSITVTTADMRKLKLTVSGIFDNYISNHVFIGLDTCAEQWGETPEIKSALVCAPEGADIYSTAERIADADGVRSISISEDSRARIENMMSSLKYVIGLIVLCAGLLAFIVLYNLTNINISERIREIATIKVLGFYRRETEQYVFRENLVLTGMGALFGLILGVALHAFVMDSIVFDMMYFAPRIKPLSYVISVVLTFVFALIVNLMLRRKIDNVDMAGALKSIE